MGFVAFSYFETGNFSSPKEEREVGGFWFCHYKKYLIPLVKHCSILTPTPSPPPLYSFTVNWHSIVYIHLYTLLATTDASSFLPENHVILPLAVVNNWSITSV